MAALHDNAHFEDPVECANCGVTQDLLMCSRCRTVWFCGIKCQKSYWPFHKTQCTRNEFADLVEGSEPKFARWMRSHGKLAVLKDDEVDRLERAGQAASGPSRQDVMESMYGRLQPKPKEPGYSAEERAAMRLREREEAACARRALLCGATYQAIEVPAGLGLECSGYKWRQNQSHVELFVPIPQGAGAAQVSVRLQPQSLSVVIDERPILVGQLYREIKAEESTWYIQDSVLEIVMLKRCRRGHYEGSATNADTFWQSVLCAAPPQEALHLDHPPTKYYWSPCDGDAGEVQVAPRLLPADRQDEAVPREQAQQLAFEA